MTDEISTQKEHLPPAVQQALARTPARLFTGRAGPGCLTATSLQLRADHAAARDAVYDEVDLERDLAVERVNRYGLFTVHTLANSRTEYLMRPDHGRRFDAASEAMILRNCQHATDLQLVLADGLSATAVSRHGGMLLDLLWEQAQAQKWQCGRPFLVQNCRVGILNEIGRLLRPHVVVLLIGERPGLAQSASLSAYLAYQPQPGHTDAQRNLISNIHPQGVSLTEAADRILHLAARLWHHQCSGVMVKEEGTSRLSAS